MAEGHGAKWWNNQTPDYPELKREDRPSWKLLAGEEMRVRTLGRSPCALSSACQAQPPPVLDLDPALSPHLCSSFDKMSEFPLPLRIAALACACRQPRAWSLNLHGRTCKFEYGRAAWLDVSLALHLAASVSEATISTIVGCSLCLMLEFALVTR
jgi:hypothetical protein